MMLEPNFLWVMGGCVLLSLASARVGLYYFLQKKSLSGDVISHALLPGVVIGYLIAAEKNLFFLLSGAFVFGLLSVLLMDRIQHLTFIKPDVSMAVVLSSFYGLGIVLLSFTNRLPLGNQAGLDTFLFGKAASLTTNDVISYAVLAIVILVLIHIFEQPFMIMSFDSSFAESIGLNVQFYRNLLTILIISAVVLGVQAVGVVLMSAFVILPSLIGRLLSYNIRIVRMISLASGVFMAVSGAFISYYQAKMPTGPVMVLAGGSLVIVIMILKLLFAKYSNAVYRMKYKKKINREDILKFLYKTTVENKVTIPIDETHKSRSAESGTVTTKREFKKNLIQLAREGFICLQNGKIYLTEKGKKEAERIVRVHRLWEVYLTKKLRKSKSIVHANADMIEHCIPEQVEKMLISELGHPTKDPHNKDIPYAGS